jgi:hypothetical protein
MVSIVNGVWKRFKQDSAKVLVNSSVCLSVLLNVVKVGVKHRNEAVAQSLIPFFVVPASRFCCVVKDCREKTEFAHPRSAFILLWNSSSVSAEPGS